MKTTVVIPNYNGIQYIENCLQSLRCQTIRDFAVILVDNASADGSRELAEKQFPEVRMVTFQQNEGFCKAVNAGIRQAETPYIILLNNDTTVEAHFIEKMEQAIERSGRIFSVGAKMLSMANPAEIDDAGNFYCALGWAYARGKGKTEKAYQKADRIFAACAGAAIYRKSILEEIGFFDERHFAYLEDMDIGYRAKIAGYVNYFEPDAIVYHAGSGSSGSRYNEFKIKLSSRNNIYLFYKNMPFLQILLNLPFLLIGYALKVLFFIKKGFGELYIKGLLQGIAYCLTKEARAQKVRFRVKNLGNYVIIQLELWINIIRKIILR